MMGRLAGKTALITGCARGIGRAIALRFAAEGANLVLCDLNLAGLRGVGAEAESYGVKAICRRTDVARREQVQQLVDEGVDEFGIIDIAVNNAGIFFNAPFERTSDEQYERIMAVNVKSVFSGLADRDPSLAQARGQRRDRQSGVDRGCDRICRFRRLLRDQGRCRGDDPLHRA